MKGLRSIKMKRSFIKSICIITLVGMTAACGKSQENNFVQNSERLKTQMDSGVSSQAIASNHFGTGTDSHSVSLDVFVENPELHVDRIGSYVGNKIKITANHISGGIEGAPGMVSSWQIMNGTEVIIDEEGGAQLEWTPTVAGTYSVKHTMIEGEVEVSVTEMLYVLNDVNQETDLIDRFWTLDEKLVGTWTGEIKTNYGIAVHVDVIFYADGSYVISRISQDEIYPMYPFDPNMRLPMPFPSMSHEVMHHEIFPISNVSSFSKEKGRFELLDIWANGEVVGNMQLENHPPSSSENMKRIRFNDDYSMLFFELSFDPFFMGDADTYVLTRISDTAEAPSLEVIKEQLVGGWHGNVISPWAMPYEVSFQFNTDGTYSANSLTETVLHDGEKLGLVSPLFFGAVEPTSEETQYTIDSYTDELASGDISLALKNGEIVTGTISHLEMSIDYSILTFTFSHYGKYGPMRYVLERQQ